MPEFLDFVPLYVRTEDDIRTDFDIDANAGLNDTDPAWVDARPPGFFHMVTQPFVIESARIHDQIATLPAISFIEFAFGIYLDYHAAALNTERKAALAATGFADFVAPVGTEITTGTQISTEQTDANVPPIIFLTTETVIVNGPLSSPTGATESVLGTGGDLAAGDRYYKWSAWDAAGETTAGTEVHVHIASGTTNAAQLNIDPVPNALGYYLYVGTTPGGENMRSTVDSPGVLDDGGLVWESAVPIVTNTTGGEARANIQARDAGLDSDVGPDELIQMITSNQSVVSVTNPLACTGGADVENDPDLQARLLALREGDGPGRQVDYVSWVLDQPGVSKVQVLPLWNGPGTVGIVVMDQNGGAVSQGIVDAVQAELDPYPALGGGQAPIDHLVTVMTPAQIPINITAAITWRTGYSLDGANNTIAQRQSILDAFTAYFTTVLVGETIIKDHLKAIFYQVEGVVSVNMTVPAADTAISSVTVPPQRGVLGTMTLS